MSIIRIGSNDKYASGWDAAFGKGKRQAANSGGKRAAVKKQPAKKKSAKKKATRKK